jgi:hypothetical protein
MTDYTKARVRGMLEEELSTYPGAAEGVYARLMILLSETDVRDVERGRSMRPAAIWKRRKQELKQLATLDCTYCHGRGLIVGVPSSGVRGTECVCTAHKVSTRIVTNE